MHRGRPGTTMGLAIIVVAGFANPGHAESPTPSASPSSSPITCPTPTSTQVFVHINVVPAGSSCEFDAPSTIDDMKIVLGDGVDWSFCSTCSADTKVILEARNQSGPFDHFRTVSPNPDNNHRVTVSLPHDSRNEAWGKDATKAGDWKYHITLTSQAGNVWDDIDPKLEIDDDNPLHGYLQWILLALLGVALLGFGAFRMMRRKRA